MPFVMPIMDFNWNKSPAGRDVKSNFSQPLRHSSTHAINKTDCVHDCVTLNLRRRTVSCKIWPGISSTLGSTTTSYDSQTPFSSTSRTVLSVRTESLAACPEHADNCIKLRTDLQMLTRNTRRLRYVVHGRGCNPHRSLWRHWWRHS